MTWRPTPERRSAALEIRVAGGGRKLEGYAALFGVTANLGTFRETIRPGAFTRSLASGRDVLALVDHDPQRLLARTRSGTLRLSQDSKGLAFELDAPDTAPGRDVIALAERGDLGGMSFGFSTLPSGEERDGDMRALTGVTLHEISVVQAWPAYEGTIVAARSTCVRALRLNAARRSLDLLSLAG